MNTLHFLQRLSWALVVVWAVTIFILSSLSGQEIEKISPFQLWDKAEHFIAYTSGAMLLAFALKLSTKWSWKRVVLVAAVIISAFGATDEIHQLFTPGRSGADVRDWSADTLGALAGATIACGIYAVSQRKNSLAPTAD